MVPAPLHRFSVGALLGNFQCSFQTPLVPGFTLERRSWQLAAVPLTVQDAVQKAVLVLFVAPTVMLIPSWLQVRVQASTAVLGCPWQLSARLGNAPVRTREARHVPPPDIESAPVDCTN
ncbi:uncharacterized protein LOC142775890 [Rhipicephalus microplus]|uniref:uncharacterized protein LOC142775890 n=1 Tax=Rhipicephalus microplus TaxID=6941 RepID=UPI003F6BD774